jgi:hypothetical protein
MDAAEPSSSTSTEATTNQWTVHIAPSGRTYYYNGVTQESTWERWVESVHRKLANSEPQVGRCFLHRPKELTDLADGSLGGGIGMMIQMGMQNLDAGGNLQVLAGAQLAGAQVQGGAEGQQQAQLQGMPMQGGQMQDGMAFPAPYGKQFGLFQAPAQQWDNWVRYVQHNTRQASTLAWAGSRSTAAHTPACNLTASAGKSTRLTATRVATTRQVTCGHALFTPLSNRCTDGFMSSLCQARDRRSRRLRAAKVTCPPPPTRQPGPAVCWSSPLTSALLASRTCR